MNCKNCGHEVDKKAFACTSCGCKITKPIYQKWWFWVLIVVAVFIIGSAGGDNSSTLPGEGTVSNSAEEQLAAEEQPATYETVDLQVMFDDLDANAMKAESNYAEKMIEFECKISNFDSDGAYISVRPIGADEWDFASAMCYIKDDMQKEFLIQKNIADRITVKGKVKSIGEVMGYSIDIHEVY